MNDRTVNNDDHHVRFFDRQQAWPWKILEMKNFFYITLAVVLATTCSNCKAPSDPEPFAGERNASGYHSRNKIGVAENWPEFANHFEECYAAIVMPKANISFQTKIEAMLVASVQAQGVHLQAESAYCLHRMGVRTIRILNLFDFENHAAAFTDKELQTYRFFKNAGVMPEQSKAADIDRLLNVVSQRNAFGYHDRDQLEFWMHFPEFSNPFWDIDNMITLGTEHVSMK